MNEVQIFENVEFGRIRSIIKNNEVWFVGKDVAEILGYQNASKALSDHVDDEDKLNNISLSSLGQRGGWIINESGLYSLILSSKLSAAKKFKRWVTSEVLPSIRKTGSYGKELKAKEIEARLNNSRARIAAEYRKIAEKTDIPEYKHICQQKAAEALSGTPLLLPMEEVKEVTYSATEIGKILGVSAKKIGAIANKHNLKTAQYGKFFYSKSEYSCKEVETFRYYECAIAKFREILKGGAAA